ncbi:MAG: DUF3857 domain-containing protein [Sphingobacteriaceae bacterium]|nr:MAG: DUF3857 domain-containing protein [Sphingobacteriaceae bacterium]
MKTYKGDTSVNALVLTEYGTAFFVSNANVPPIQFEYHVKIKIFNTEGLKKGTVEIPLYSRDKGSYDQLRSVKGITYNKGDKGQLERINLANDQVQTTKIDEHHSIVKFTLPKMSKGSVIEYSYIIETPYINNFKTWMFQSDIPKLSSTYEISIPKLYGYEVSLKGSLPLTTNTFKEVPRCFFLNGVNYECVTGIYHMENIPAFVAQPNMLSPKSFMSGVYFQLTDMAVISNFVDRNMSSGRQAIARNWKEFSDFLKLQDNFGDQIKKKFPFKNELAKVAEQQTTPLDKAKAVFTYIQKNFTWNGYDGIFTDDGVKKSFEKRKGSVGDINIALISALNSAGISADPVLLSTRDNGTVNKAAPSLNDLNYVVAKVIIGDKVYFADATDPNVVFGQLPSRALNGQGYIISLHSTDDWIDLH